MKRETVWVVIRERDGLLLSVVMEAGCCSTLAQHARDCAQNEDEPAKAVRAILTWNELGKKKK